MLKLEHINKKFGDLKVLNDINLEINKGDIVVIIGPSGSGKSTLLRTMNLLTIPDSGDVIFEGVKLTENNILEYRQKIGMVFQSFNLFNNLTVLDNIILSKVKLNKCSEEDAIKEANALLKSIGLYAKKDVYPSKLSGGQMQRVAIARSLIMNPDIMLFDEPTSALDAEMVKDVQEMMKKLASQGMTMVIVTHELSFVKSVANKLVFMSEGKIVCSGTYEEMMSSEDKTVKLFLSNIK